MAAALTSVVGIGGWTADIYLLMALCRPDAWPTGDLALAIAAATRSVSQLHPTLPSYRPSAKPGAPGALSPPACSGTST